MVQAIMFLHVIHVLFWLTLARPYHYTCQEELMLSTPMFDAYVRRSENVFHESSAGDVHNIAVALYI